MILGSELFHNGTYREGYVILVSRDNLVRIFLCSLLNHRKERRGHFLTVDDESTTEDFVTAVFRVELRKAEYFRVSELAVKLCLNIVEVLDFFGRECQTFLLVVRFEVVNLLNSRRLKVDGENILVQTRVHARKHGVVVRILACYGEIFFNTRDTLEVHVLCNFHSIRTPWRNHLTAGTYEVTLERFAFEKRSVAVKPAKFIYFILCELVIYLSGNHGLLLCLKKQNHNMVG